MTVPSQNPAEPFPLQPVVLKILGDAVLAAALLRAGDLPAEQQVQAVVLALLLGMGASIAAGAMLVRAGHKGLWDITSLACLVAMAVLLTLHGVLFVALALGAIAVWRWKQLAAAGER